MTKAQMSERTCEVEGCDGAYYATDLCKMHYEKQSRKRKSNRSHVEDGERECSYGVCHLPYHAKGMCRHHYAMESNKRRYTKKKLDRKDAKIRQVRAMQSSVASRAKPPTLIRERLDAGRIDAIVAAAEAEAAKESEAAANRAKRSEFVHDRY